MNDGIIALIVQWCLLCLCWMGFFDKQLRNLGVNRAVGLAMITLFLVATYSNWVVNLPPIQINLGGAVLPMLVAAWVWTSCPTGGKRYLLLLSGICTLCVFSLRTFFFWDPVLLIWDERYLLPLVIVVLALLLVRDWRQQLFLLFVMFVISDALYMGSTFQRWQACTIGNEYAEDLLWSAVPLWMLCAYMWRGITIMLRLMMQKIRLPLLKWKTKTNADR